MRIELYYFEACPYCQKVLRFLKENNLEIPLKDTRKEPQLQQELIAIGGKKQVPCLVIDGKALYESDDIILWLKEFLVHNTNNAKYAKDN